MILNCEPVPAAAAGSTVVGLGIISPLHQNMDWGNEVMSHRTDRVSLTPLSPPRPHPLYPPPPTERSEVVLWSWFQSAGRSRTLWGSISSPRGVSVTSQSADPIHRSHRSSSQQEQQITSQTDTSRENQKQNHSGCSGSFAEFRNHSATFHPSNLRS